MPSAREAVAAREDIRLPSGHEELAGWLYRPAPAGPAPCVVMAHGFGAEMRGGLDAYAERFAAAGHVVLAFDYRNLGASGGEPRQLVHTRRQHADWEAAIAHARALEGVDGSRIALWGTSNSGGHVIHVASRDRRVAAVVAQARAAPRGELVTYPVSHFEVYRAEHFERAAADQLEFLGRHLVTG